MNAEQPKLQHNVDNIVIGEDCVPKVVSQGYHSPYDQDWRIFFGLIVTTFYLLLIGMYISLQVGWVAFGHLSVERLGSFLEGAFAPLAFLWLVIGYFLQKKELRLNTEAMKMQFVEIQKSTEQATLQSQAILASEMHQRKESFLLIAEAVKTQLGSIIGMLYLSSQMADGNEEQVSQEKLAEMWSTLGKRDSEVFVREMLVMFNRHSERYNFKLYFGTEIRTRHTENFEFNFARMERAALDCDEDGMVADAIRGSAHGLLYQRIQEVRRNPPPGLTIGVYDFDPDSRES
ncbi:MAG: hypothetical protein HOC23_23440 [Halieaceae bacterium]|jgi:hypothetical protein|nr:hypothetical protein [Halieaceae bacterium]